MLRRLFACLCVALLLVCSLMPLQASAMSDTDVNTVFEYLTTEKGYSTAAACGIIACVQEWEEQHPDVPTFMRDETDMAAYYRLIGTGEDTVQARIDWFYIKVMQELSSGGLFARDYYKTLEKADDAQGCYDSAYYLYVLYFTRSEKLDSPEPASVAVYAHMVGAQAVNDYYASFEPEADLSFERYKPDQQGYHLFYYASDNLDFLLSDLPDFLSWIPDAFYFEIETFFTSVISLAVVLVLLKIFHG